MCVCILFRAVRAGDPTRVPPNPTVTGAAGKARSPRCPSGDSCTPAAAEPNRFRVAHCQSADNPRGRHEVVKPRQRSQDTGPESLTNSHAPSRGQADLGWQDDVGGVSTMGGAAGIRTPDLRRARAALSRLSYGPQSCPPPRHHLGWARLDSNQGPRPYQGRALTT